MHQPQFLLESTSLMFDAKAALIQGLGVLYQLIKLGIVAAVYLA